MALTTYKYWSGGFKAEFTQPGTGVAPVIDLGTTEQGLRFSARQSSQPIREDRFGDSVVDELYLGLETPILTVESLTWQTGTADHMLNQFFQYMHHVRGGAAAGAGIAAGDFAVNSTNFGALLNEELAGSLTCTATTGRLAGLVAQFAITFPKVVPIEPLELLLSLRRPTRIPFGFRVFPIIETDGGTGTHLKYWTVDAWEADA